MTAPNKNYPCGCTPCTCEDEAQCQGCGAKHCSNYPACEFGQAEAKKKADREFMRGYFEALGGEGA